MLFKSSRMKTPADRGGFVCPDLGTPLGELFRRSHFPRRSVIYLTFVNFRERSEKAFFRIFQMFLTAYSGQYGFPLGSRKPRCREYKHEL